MTQAPPQQGHDPQGGVIPLPPVSQATAPPPPQRDAGRRLLGRFLTILVLGLAFLSASFAARNSDVWFHLATGRLLARGQFSFGVDPFAYTTQTTYWVCHSWLFDLALYELHGLAAGAGLVVLKALLVTVLAGLLLSAGRSREPSGTETPVPRAERDLLPIVCTTLAILAMGPRMLLQPACVSYFLLGLTFWLLWRPLALGKTSLSCSLALPLVFALWVNVDEWFLLGPLLAALFWLGGGTGILARARSAGQECPAHEGRGQRLTPGWVVPVGLAACLLNPHTFHAFTLPAELSPVAWTSGLPHDVRFQAQFASPWQREYLHAATRLNAAALAYFALTFLGLASFLLHRPALRDGRLLVWLPFALLAAWQARAIPFFAVVTAPITALNYHDYFAARRWRPGPALQAVVLVPALLALLGLTWLGWLAGYDREERHVAWALQPEPALQEVAETLADWRSRGLLPDGERVFALAPEVAHYSAWAEPGEQHFFDHRYPLFAGAAGDYETVCQALLPSPSSPPNMGDEGEADWRQVLRDHHVTIVIFYDREPRRLFAVLRRLAADPKHWTLLHPAGPAVIAGWNEARPPEGFAPLAFDADRLAFAAQDERARREAPPAPGRGPERLPPRRDFWARLAHAPAPPAEGSAAATTYLHYFHDSETTQRERQWRFLLRAYAASLAGLPAQPSGVPQVAFQLLASREIVARRQDDTPQFLVREQLGPFFAPLVERSPALPLLAVRAARRAVADNPADANAWLRLGQAYLLLRNLTGERSSEGVLPPLAQLRHVQIVTALEQAARLDPDLEVAHHELAFLYGERNYLDRALVHRQAEARLSRRSGARPGESAEEFAYRLELLDKDTAKLADLVEDGRKKYASAPPAPQGDRLTQARRALGLGLAQVALEEVLLTSPADLLRAPGIQLELVLLLTLGRAGEVRAILSDEGLRAKKHGLDQYQLLQPRHSDGSALYALPYHWPAYDWLHVLAAASVGDYLSARGDLRTLRAGLAEESDRKRQERYGTERRAWAILPGLLSEPRLFLPAFTAAALVGGLQDKTAIEVQERALRAQQADLCVLEGLLALEQGDPAAARSAFAEAEDLSTWSPGAPLPCAGRSIAAAYLGQLNAAGRVVRTEPRP